MANRTQIQTALQKPYDRILFGKEVLSPVFGSGFTLSTSAIPASVQPNKSEQAVIQSVAIYGNINLEDGTEITCYEITLQPTVRIEHSKVAIQRYVRKLLTAGQIALVNFIAPQNKKVWRLTLVAKDSELTDQGIKEKTTHAKRYTYLLGPSETCKTAAERFETLSTEKQITFQALVNAFSVEKLSKAFFDEYTLHYQKFCDYLQESNFRKSVFKISIPANAAKEEKDKACKPIRDFVKKLLGRIVFLYFVQKKGWLGASNTNYQDGLKNFIKELFTQSGGNDTFYPNWLTVLFFETLNKERSNDDFKMPDARLPNGQGKKVKVPFLNGGLFDKEDFDDASLPIPAKLFHHPDFEDAILTEKNWSNARGFLDFLDAFNFTVHEDSPDDHTVAVDPEMLGHIFENLLEDNKDKGAFYTPKEIVHYMCQESLTEYLTTHCLKHRLNGFEDYTEEQIKSFVAHLVKHKDAHPNIEELKSAQTLNQTNQWFRQLDTLLDSVKICDPAIGSGAFPMGLLQEIHAIKEVLAYELQQPWKPAEVKENIIQNSVYGVDIEKGAVDIARLRFWLSLVVDEETPRALPNLDYKIVVGDSLVSKFEGEIIEIDWEIKEGTQANLFGNDNVLKRQSLLKQITEKQQAYFYATHKQKLAADIRSLKIDILINQLELMINTKGLEKKPSDSGKKAAAQMELWLQTQGWKNTIAQLQKLKQNKDEPFKHFDWKLDFPEVLNPYLVNGNAGFDIVIGNPPYVRQERLGQSLKHVLKKRFPKVANGTADLYVYFFGIGLELFREKGVLCYITLNKYLKTKYGLEIRNLLANEYDVDIIIDFFELPVFNAATDSSITKLIATKEIRETKYFPVKTLDNLNLFQLTSGHHQKVIKDEMEWKFVDNTQESLLQKITKDTISLKQFSNDKIFRGITTGANHIFIIDKPTRNKIVKSDPKSNKYIQPYIEPTKIDQWDTPHTNKYIIGTFPSLSININNFIGIKDYLNPFKKLLEPKPKNYSNDDWEGRKPGSYKWFEIQDNIAYYRYFSAPKIIYIHTAVKHRFYFDTEGRYINNSCYMIISDSQFLFCFLNSKLFEWFKKIKFVAYGDAEESGRAKLDYNKMITVPIKNISENIEKIFSKLVHEIKSKKANNNDTTDLEQQIDNLIYRLYDLSYNEVKVIDPAFPLSQKEYEDIRLD